MQSKDLGRLLGQLAKEFCAPFLVAVAWTAWQLWPTFDLKTALANFGPSFFLASWAISQVFRVKKQQKIEGDLTEILEKTKEAASAIHERVGQVLDYMTGGESYAYVDLYIHQDADGRYQPRATLCHVGSIDPMYNVEVWIVNNRRDFKSASPVGWEYKKDLFLPHAIETIQWGFSIPQGETRIDLSVSVSARNRPTNQRIVGLLLNDRWTIATTVSTVGYAHNWELRQQVPTDFPRLPDGSPDWYYGDQRHSNTPSPTSQTPRPME